MGMGWYGDGDGDGNGNGDGDGDGNGMGMGMGMVFFTTSHAYQLPFPTKAHDINMHDIYIFVGVYVRQRM